MIVAEGQAIGQRPKVKAVKGRNRMRKARSDEQTGANGQASEAGFFVA